MDEYDQCVAPDNHLCTQSFSEKLIQLKDDIVDGFTDSQLVRAKFRKAEDELSDNALMHYIPFIVNTYIPKMVEVMTQCSQMEEEREERLIEHVMVCWFHPDCSICPGKERSFENYTILRKMQERGLLYKAELKGHDMNRIIPGYSSTNSKDILEWLDNC